MVSPARLGSRGRWIKTGATWRDIASPHGHRLPAEQRRLAHDFEIRHAGDFGWLYHATALAIAYPLALTALIAAACIALEAGRKRAGLGILFEPPARLQRAVDPASAGTGQSRRGSRATSSTVPG